MGEIEIEKRIVVLHPCLKPTLELWLGSDGKAITKHDDNNWEAGGYCFLFQDKLPEN